MSYQGENIQTVWNSVTKSDREEIYFSELKDVLTDFDWQKLTLGLADKSLLNENWLDLSPELQELIMEFHKLISSDPSWAGLDLIPI